MHLIINVAISKSRIVSPGLVSLLINVIPIVLNIKPTPPIVAVRHTKQKFLSSIFFKVKTK